MLVGSLTVLQVAARSTSVSKLGFLASESHLSYFSEPFFLLAGLARYFPVSCFHANYF